MPLIETNVGERVEVDRSWPLPAPSAPWEQVASRFDSTLGMAEDMLELLIGSDGLGGYLGTLNSLLEDAPTIDVSVDDVNTDIAISNVLAPPVFNTSDLESFPNFTTPDPEFKTIPTIDVSDLVPPEEPTDINPTIEWSEVALNNDIYAQLLARILNDLVSGATGLNAEVQENIFFEGQERQRRENEKAYRAIQNEFASRGSTLPSGALLAALANLNTEILAQNSQLNRTIVITQAELAQKNSQFIIDQARMLETLLRGTRDGESTRKLDYAKALALLVIQTYSEKVKLYISIAEANKVYVEAQVSNLQAIVAYNMAFVEQYKGVIEAHGIKVQAIASKNASLTDIYRAEMQGYDSETTAISRTDNVKLDKIKLDLGEAELNLRASIENAKNLLLGYSTESELKEKITNDMAMIANQAMVGSLSAVNASASVGYTGSESISEDWSHSDSLQESHTYPHDPTT